MTLPDAVELKKLAKQLQTAPNHSELIGILSILKKDYQVTESLLRESKIGLAVGKLRTHTAKDVADLAKEIVKKWKHAVDKEKQSAPTKATTNGKITVLTDAGKRSVTPATPTGTSTTRTAKSDNVKGTTGDNTRDKCMELIYDALAFDSGAPVEIIAKRAQGIESAAYSHFDGTTAAYKAKIRSLFVNLKDKNNPGLREGVVSGEIPSEKLPTMTSEDMASEERKAADLKIKDANFFNSLGAEEQQAETDAFQCSRCKQRKCRYRQAQTRSADEPMTTFVTCTVCGNRWKFS
ncbi:transcription factor S-II, central domain-containing protein [Amanita rubescens]|nr:transcription factor S-II, central domain-containing protein [Amanita rubescens]